MSETRFACTSGGDCPTGQRCQDRVCVDVATDAASPADAAATDVAVRDTMVHDATFHDAAVHDATVHDAAVPDAAVPDAMVPDTAVGDAALRDTTAADSCTATGSETTAAGSCGDLLDNDCDGRVDEHDDGCWWDPRWSHRRKLTFGNASRPALDGFVVLLALNADRIDYGQARSDGGDLQFVEADDATALPFEVETWVSGGTSLIWVRVPRIDAASAGDFIWMYYGRSDATSAQQPAQVWADYDAVYHLANLQDATGNCSAGADHGTGAGSGQIGAARTLDGASAWIELGSNLPLLRSAGAATLSAWINTSNGDLNQHIISIAVGGACSTNSRATLISEYGNIRVGGRAGDGDALFAMNTTDQPIQTGRWHHLVGVIDYGAGVMTSYIDGRLDLSGPFTVTQSTTAATGAACAAIGSEDTGDAARFAGAIDEVRIAPLLRSTSWLDAEFQNQSQDAFVSYGVAQTH